jgi:hypothetical protein
MATDCGEDQKWIEVAERHAVTGDGTIVRVAGSVILNDVILNENNMWLEWWDNFEWWILFEWYGLKRWGPVLRNYPEFSWSCWGKPCIPKPGKLTTGCNFWCWLWLCKYLRYFVQNVPALIFRSSRLANSLTIWCSCGWSFITILPLLRSKRFVTEHSCFLATHIHYLSANFQDRERFKRWNSWLFDWLANRPKQLTRRDWVLFEKLVVLLMLNKTDAFYGIRRFIFVFTVAHHWSLA